MPLNRCPACENTLTFAPWRADVPSFKKCPFCGIQFGDNDAREDLRESIYQEWRTAWIANEREPFKGDEWQRVSALATSNAQKKRAAGGS